MGDSLKLISSQSVYGLYGLVIMLLFDIRSRNVTARQVNSSQES